MAQVELGERIATLREEQALTQADLAERARISPSTLSQIESGKVPRPHVGTVRKIARALGVEPQDLRRAEDLVLTGASPKTEAPQETWQDVAEQAGFLEAIAAVVDSAANRLQTRLEETSRTDGNALTVLLEDGWLEHRGAQQLLAEAEEEAAQKRREASAVRRARAKLAQAVTRLTDISDEIAATVLGDLGELEWTEEPTGVVVSLVEEYRSRRAG